MRQIEMDFTRGDKLGMLDDVFFEGRSKCSTKAALRAIESCGRECYASEKTLSDKAGMSERTFQRALSRLVDASLVTCDLMRNRYGTVTNHYRIVWTELQMKIDRQKSMQNRSNKVEPPVPTDTPSGQTDTPSGQTDTPSGQTDTPSGHERYDNMTSNTQLTTKNRHQPETKSAVGDDLEILEKEFRSIGLHRSVALAREFRGTIEAVRDAIAVYSRQRRKFNGPGAVVDFLRSGAWPSDGVLSSAELIVREQTNKVTSIVTNRESVRCEISREWKREGRWVDATEFEINAEIDRRIEIIRRSHDAKAAV